MRSFPFGENGLVDSTTQAVKRFREGGLINHPEDYEDSALPSIKTYLLLMVKKLTKTVPPKSGPTPQGLNVPLKQVKIVRLEKINGRNRQSTSKRSNQNY